MEEYARKLMGHSCEFTHGGQLWSTIVPVEIVNGGNVSVMDMMMSSGLFLLDSGSFEKGKQITHCADLNKITDLSKFKLLETFGIIQVTNQICHKRHF